MSRQVVVGCTEEEEEEEQWILQNLVINITWIYNFCSLLQL